MSSIRPQTPTEALPPFLLDGVTADDDVFLKREAPLERDAIFDTHLSEHRRLFDVLVLLRSEVEAVAQVLADCLVRGNKIMMCGNGGSASDAQHFAAELTGRFQRDRPALAALALSCNASVLTCIGNDYGFEEVYARQVQALGVDGDCLIAISTSGNSENVVRAVKAARKRGVVTIGMTGEGGTLARISQHVLAVPSMTTARVQEAHIFLAHTLCALIEEHLGLR